MKKTMKSKKTAKTAKTTKNKKATKAPKVHKTEWECSHCGKTVEVDLVLEMDRHGVETHDDRVDTVRWSHSPAGWLFTFDDLEQDVCSIECARAHELVIPAEDEDE